MEINKILLLLLNIYYLNIYYLNYYIQNYIQCEVNLEIMLKKYAYYKNYTKVILLIIVYY